MPTVQLKRIRRFEGKVVSAKTPKTIVVEVVQTTKHKKYLKNVHYQLILTTLKVKKC